MRKLFQKIISISFFLFLLFLLLTKPELSLKYASKGLLIWYKNMVPSLFPMMILTSCMIKLNLTASFSKILHPVVHKIFHTSENGTYAMFMGFLCGFPMGAKIICELYNQNKLSKEEAQSLLPICNNIGPVFMLTYGLLTFQTPHKYLSLILFYCIPLCYAYLTNRKKFFRDNSRLPQQSLPFSQALDEAISENAMSMLSLGGYLMFFNLLLMIPTELLPLNTVLASFIACFTEITNGLSYPTALPNYFYLSFLQFGGICCLFQTLRYIQKTNLSFQKYLKHKSILTIVTFIFFFVLYVFFFYDGYV